jgi:8-oxo-dGTP pyrophosphatase MutT (NUDIX family)
LINEYTSPWVLKHSTDPLHPAHVDWEERLRGAWIPYQVIDGRPVCPDRLMLVLSDVVHRGRNGMKYWGENKMADALITLTFRGLRYVLLIARGDGLGWAIPGGGVKPGESAQDAAVRELKEETGLDLFDITDVVVTLDAPCWVPDPRGSVEAWPVTVVMRADLGDVDVLPEVRGEDDARDARWFAIRETFLAGPLVFPAHRKILAALS